jgi:ribose transport system permease protein
MAAQIGFEQSKAFLMKWIRQGGIFISLIVVFTVFSILVPIFLHQNNLINIALQASINAVVAIGMTFVIITAGIDLSVGAIVALSSVITAKFLVSGTPILLSVLINFLIGIICGMFNGVLISYLKLQPFLVTLGAMSLFRGLALIISNGIPIYDLPEQFKTAIALLKIGPIPIPVVIMVIFSILAFIILKFTKLGEYIFAIGGNEEATRLSGVNVKMYKTMTYAFSGIAAALGSLILTGRLGAAEAVSGTGYELDAIAAAAIGGASLAGGRGSILGTIIGAIILSALRNGLTLLNVQSFYQMVATGIIIMIAIIIDRLSRMHQD